MKEHWSGSSVFIQHYKLEKKRKTSRGGGGTCFVRLLPQQDCNWRQWFLFSLILFFFLCSPVLLLLRTFLFVCLLFFFIRKLQQVGALSPSLSVCRLLTSIGNRPRAHLPAQSKKERKKATRLCERTWWNLTKKQNRIACGIHARQRNHGRPDTVDISFER